MHVPHQKLLVKGLFMLQRFRTSPDERGVTAIEYGILASLIAVVIIAVVGVLGGNLSTVFSRTASAVTQTSGGTQPPALDCTAGHLDALVADKSDADFAWPDTDDHPSMDARQVAVTVNDPTWMANLLGCGATVQMTSYQHAVHDQWTWVVRNPAGEVAADTAVVNGPWYPGSTDTTTVGWWRPMGTATSSTTFTVMDTGAGAAASLSGDRMLVGLPAGADDLVDTSAEYKASAMQQVPLFLGVNAGWSVDSEPKDTVVYRVLQMKLAISLPAEDGSVRSTKQISHIFTWEA